MDNKNKISFIDAMINNNNNIKIKIYKKRTNSGQCPHGKGECPTRNKSIKKLVVMNNMNLDKSKLKRTNLIDKFNFPLPNGQVVSYIGLT